MKCRHIISNDRKKIYRILKKGIYGFNRTNDPVYGCEKDRVVTTGEENPKIKPQKGEINKTVLVFYYKYKSEAMSEVSRVKWFYTGISIKRI